jgi:hypothetical protein
MTALSNNYENISTILSLRSSDQGINLLYIVEIDDNGIVHHCFESENYFQALAVAAKVFSKLKTKQNVIGSFGVSIEASQGRGISYDVNTFTFDAFFENSDEFYQELINEFEYEKLYRKSNNVIFRKIVNKHKLNEYQEHRFLQRLKDFLNEKASS